MGIDLVLWVIPWDDYRTKNRLIICFFIMTNVISRIYPFNEFLKSGKPQRFENFFMLFTLREYDNVEK